MRLIGLCAVVCLVGAACSQPQNHRAGPATTPSRAPTASWTPASSGRVLTLDDTTPVASAPGVRLRPSIGEDRGDGIGAGVECLTPDGMAIVDVAKVVKNPDLGLSQSKLELVEPGGTATKIPSLSRPKPRQVISASCDEDTVVWAETSSSVGNGPWNLVAYDRSTRGIREIAADDARDAMTWSGPVVAGDRVYWAAGELTGDEVRPTHSDIYSRDLAAQEPVRREVADARGAVVHGDTMYFTKDNAVDAAVPEGRTEVFRRDLRTGADSRVDAITPGADEHLTGMDFVGDDLAWVISETATAEDPAPLPSRLMIRTADGTTTTIKGIAFGVPVITPSLVTWNANGDRTGDMWAYDRSRGAILKLAGAPGLDWVAASGNHLAWREPAEWRFADLTPVECTDCPHS